MKKVWKVRETKKGTFKRRAAWLLETDELITYAVCVLVLVFVATRCVIG